MAHSIGLHPVAQLTSPLAIAILAAIVFAPGASNAGSQKCENFGRNPICVRNDDQVHRVFPQGETRPGSELAIGDERRVGKGGVNPKAYQEVLKGDQMLVPAGTAVDTQPFTGAPQKTPATPAPSSSAARDLSERLSALNRRCLPGQCASGYQGPYGGRQVYGTNRYAWISRYGSMSGYGSMGGYRSMSGYGWAGGYRAMSSYGSMSGYRTMGGYGSTGGYRGVIRRW